MGFATNAIVNAVWCIVVVLIYTILKPDQTNEFHIYKPGGTEIKFYHNDTYSYHSKGPWQFAGDLVQLQGYTDASYIDYIKEYKTENLKPILNKDGKALMSIWLSKFDDEKTTLGEYYEVAYVYWITKDIEKQLILETDHVVEYLRQLTLNELEHAGIYQFVDKLYLNEDLPIAVGREWGYDKYKSNDMKFEYNLNNEKLSTFHMKHKQCNFDIEINLNNDMLKDILIAKDLIKYLGITKVARTLLSEGEWYHIYAILKPNISTTQIKENVVPMVEIPIKRTKLTIKKVSEDDKFVFEGELKDRNFQPVSYIHFPAEFVLMGPFNI